MPPTLCPPMLSDVGNGAAVITRVAAELRPRSAWDRPPTETPTVASIMVAADSAATAPASEAIAISSMFFCAQAQADCVQYKADCAQAMPRYAWASVCSFARRTAAIVSGATVPPVSTCACLAALLAKSAEATAFCALATAVRN